MEVVANEYFILTPAEGIVWDAQSEAIHGISFARAQQEGASLRTVLERFQQHLEGCSALVAHNLAFDKPVLVAEFLRLSMKMDVPPTLYCTMDSTKALCKIKPKTNFPKASDPYKWPSLLELHVFLFGKSEGIKFHTADGDVQCLVTCFAELVRRRLVPLEEWRLRVAENGDKDKDKDREVKITASSATDRYKEELLTK
jgi:DNA polymerase III epsilon subunit-like protein